jgi:hypothetical protein
MTLEQTRALRRYASTLALDAGWVLLALVDCPDGMTRKQLEAELPGEGDREPKVRRAVAVLEALGLTVKTDGRPERYAVSFDALAPLLEPFTVRNDASQPSEMTETSSQTVRTDGNTTVRNDGSKEPSELTEAENADSHAKSETVKTDGNDNSFKSLKEEELKEKDLKETDLKEIVILEKTEPLGGSAVDQKTNPPAAPPSARPAPKAKASISDEDCQRVVDTYNANRGKLPAAQSLDGKRRSAIAAAVKEHGLEVCLGLVADAAKEVSDNKWWLENRYSLANLLRYLVPKAEAWRSRDAPKAARGNRTEDWINHTEPSVSPKEREKIWA